MLHIQYSKRLSEVALTYLPAEQFILTEDKMTKKIKAFLALRK